MLPQEILRIEPLKSAEIAFQSTLIGNFLYCFYNNFTIFLHEMPCFYCESLFQIQYMDFTPQAKIIVTGCYLSFQIFQL